MFTLFRKVSFLCLWNSFQVPEKWPPSSLVLIASSSFYSSLFSCMSVLFLVLLFFFCLCSSFVPSLPLGTCGPLLIPTARFFAVLGHWRRRLYFECIALRSQNQCCCSNALLPLLCPQMWRLGCGKNRTCVAHVACFCLVHLLFCAQCVVSEAVGLLGIRLVIHL